MSEPRRNCPNLTKIYPTPKGEAVIVKDFNLAHQKGEFVTLIGHSGCGKSTVALHARRLSRIFDGKHHSGRTRAGRAGRIAAWVFQSPSLLPWLTGI